MPLSQAALDLLAAAPRKAVVQSDGKTSLTAYVFTTDGLTPISGFSRSKRSIDVRVGRKSSDAEDGAVQAWALHDLRRTAATEMGRLGTPEFIIAKVLNHAPKGITGQVYNRYEYLKEKRDALEQWGEALANNVCCPVESDIKE